MSDERGQTVIAGRVADQVALHGLLAKIRDLGLELLSVRRADLTDSDAEHPMQHVPSPGRERGGWK